MRSASKRWAASSVLVAGLGLAGPVGCEKPVQNTPALNRLSDPSMDPDSQWASTMLDSAQRREVEGVFATLPGLQTAATVGPGPVSAPRGRWSDLPAAANRAAGIAELAVLATRYRPDDATLETAESIEFDLLTLTFEPGRLVVRRGNPPEVYQAEAVVGLLGDRTDSADRLLAALAESLLAFGRKPQLAPLGD